LFCLMSLILVTEIFSHPCKPYMCCRAKAYKWLGDLESFVNANHCKYYRTMRDARSFNYSPILYMISDGSKLYVGEATGTFSSRYSSSSDIAHGLSTITTSLDDSVCVVVCDDNVGGGNSRLDEDFIIQELIPNGEIVVNDRPAQKIRNARLSYLDEDFMEIKTTILSRNTLKGLNSDFHTKLLNNNLSEIESVNLIKSLTICVYSCAVEFKNGGYPLPICDLCQTSSHFLDTINLIVDHKLNDDSLKFVKDKLIKRNFEQMIIDDVLEVIRFSIENPIKISMTDKDGSISMSIAVILSIKDLISNDDFLKHILL